MLHISLLSLLAGTMTITWLAAAPMVPQQPTPQSEGRTTVSLNGTWQIAESVSADGIPTVFDHTVVVPGMVNLAKPAFPDVDLFASHEYLIRWGKRYELSVPIPKDTGKYLLKAVAYPDGSRHKSPTISLRKLSVEPVAEVKADPLPGETKDKAPPTNDTKDLLKPQ